MWIVSRACQVVTSEAICELLASYTVSGSGAIVSQVSYSATQMLTCSYAGANDENHIIG